MRIHLPQKLRLWIMSGLLAVGMMSGFQSRAAEYVWTGAVDQSWTELGNWTQDGAAATVVPSLAGNSFIINKPESVEGDYVISGIPEWAKWGSNLNLQVGSGVVLDILTEFNNNLGDSLFHAGSTINFLMSGSTPGVKAGGSLVIEGDVNFYNRDKTGYNSLVCTTGSVLIQGGITNVANLKTESSAPGIDHFTISGTATVNVHSVFSMNTQNNSGDCMNLRMTGGTLNLLAAVKLAEWPGTGNGGPYIPRLDVSGGVVNALAQKMHLSRDGSANVYLSQTGVMNLKGLLDDENGTDTRSQFNLGLNRDLVLDSASTARLNIGVDGIGKVATGSLYRFGNAIVGTLSEAWVSSANISLVGNVGTIFDTEIQDPTLDGDNKGTGTGGTITLNGILSDGSIPQAEGEALAKTGKIVVKGPGTLAINGNNTYSGGTDILSGTVLVGHDNALGTGSVSLMGESALLNLNNKSVSNTINIVNGSLSNAENFLGHVNINQIKSSAVISNINLGNAGSITGNIVAGMDGENVTTVSGITGDLTLTGNNILGINGSMSNDGANCAITAGSVTLDGNATLELKLSDALTESILTGAVTGDINLHVTNGVLTIQNDQLLLNSSYSAFKYLFGVITEAGSGNVVLQKIGNDSEIIITNDGKSLLLDSNNVLGFSDKDFVINNGRIDIDIAGTDTVSIHGLGGSNTGVINTGTNADLIVELSQGGFDDTEVSTYYGTIMGKAQLDKTGAFSLIVANTVTASAVSISQGTLGFAAVAGQQIHSVVNGKLSIKNDAGLILSGSGLSLTVGELESGTNSSITFSEGARLILSAGAATTLNSIITGHGTIVVNNELTIQTGGIQGAMQKDALSDSIYTIVELSDTGRWNLVKDEAAGALKGKGVLDMKGNTLSLGSSNGLFEGTILAEDGALLVKSGSDQSVQELRTDGNSQVDINVASGSLILQNVGAQAEYGDTVVASNAHLQIGSSETGARSQVHPVNVKLDSLTMSAGSALTVFFGSSNTEQIVDPSLTVKNAAVIGDNVTIHANAYNAEEIITSGANQVSYTFIQGESGEASIATSSSIPLMGFLSTLYDWKLVASGSDILLQGQSYDGNFYEKGALSYNAESVSKLLLGNSLVIASSPGSQLRLLADTVANNITLGNISEASRIMEAAGGSTVTSLGLAQRDSLKDNMSLIRNRMTYMGVNRDVINGDMPYFNMWIQGTGGYSDLRSSGADSGYQLSSWGGIVGMDIDLSERWVVGAAFATSFGDLKASASDWADGKLNSYFANIFAKFRSKAWNHSLILTGVWSDTKLKRNVSYEKGSYCADGKSNGSGFGGMYELTYSFDMNEAKTSMIQPLFNISVTNSKIDSYNETGADNAGLAVGDQSMTTTTLALGARFVRLTGSNIFGRESICELRANVSQDMGDDRATADVAFIGTPDFSQTIRGAKVGKTALQIGASVIIPVAEQSSIFMEANGDFRSKQNSVVGSLGYRYSF